MLNLRSTNPVLNSVSETNTRAVVGPKATVAGVVNKAAIAISIAAVGGLGGAYITNTVGSGASMGLWIGSVVVTLICYFAIWRNPARAVWGAPLYSLVQGACLGSFAVMLDGILLSQGITTVTSLGVQAFIITMAIAVAMLAVYRLGLIRPGKTFRAVLFTLTAGIFLVYLAGFVMSFFGTQIPFLSLSSAFEGGNAAWIGMGINVFILIVASLWLVIDFQMIEEITDSGQPQVMEWYCVFALMVTLVWIYIEALKLAFRVAASNRN